MASTGCELVINARDFSYNAIHEMTKAAYSSDGKLTIHGADILNYKEILMLCEEGRCHIAFEDIRI